MRPPGELQDLGEEGTAAWSDLVRGRIRDVLEEGAANTFLLAHADERTPHVTVTDWPGYPVRVEKCVGRTAALELLDWFGGSSRSGGRWLQEEYVEWRVVRANGRIERVELTTELSEYWCVLAAHDPQQLLSLVASFAREEFVEPKYVYGSCDPFAATTTAAEREAAFAAAMISPGRSAYNDGRKAICCMVQSTNTLDALVRLAAAATTLRVVRDAAEGRIRCLTCSEAIPFLPEGSAQLGRASDPVVVERLGRIAYERRRVTFDDPIGIYIQGVEHTRLQTPAGEAVPAEWFTFGRGVDSADAADGRQRYQRLTLEVPRGEGTVDDLVDTATEEPIRYGGQVADLVQLVLLLRVSDADAVPIELGDPIEPRATPVDPEGCREVRRWHARFREESSADG